tara:strand:- start:130 stop:936 length:807 start_codon:yes stop_codon:yes gene_type:complete
MSNNGNMAIQPMALGDVERMGDVLARSRMFGFKNTEEAVALMLMAQAEGNHPAKAAQEYHVIQGRPALKADAMLARFQAAGGVVEWEKVTDEVVSAYFSHPTACPKPVLVDWTMERAKTARLTGKDNWSKYPRQMLKARVISEGVRMTFPGVTVGLYTPEEVMQFDDKPEVLSATVVGNDVQHITKSDALVEGFAKESVDEPTEETFNGKPRGNHFELMAELTACDTVKKAKSKVTRSYNKYAFNKKERETIDNALIEHIKRLELADV